VVYGGMGYMKNKTKRSIVKSLENIKCITAKTVGGLVTLAIKDPTGISGAIAETSTDLLITKFANELDTRKLSELETLRVSEVMEFTINKIYDNLKAHKKIRRDGFFTNKIEDISDGEEIFEGIIISSQREFENRKLKYYGKMLANIAFREDVSKVDAVQLIKLAEQLTYRQYLILSLIGTSQIMKNSQFGNMPFLRDTPFATDPKGTHVQYSHISVYQDIYEMYKIGLLNSEGDAILELGYIVPSKLNMQGVGVRLYELMELDKLENDFSDIGDLLNILKSDRLNMVTYDTIQNLNNK
jgi:hypothetical protein